MKRLMKITTLVIVLFTAMQVKAQSNPLRIGFGISPGVAPKDPTGFVFGGDIRLQQRMGNSISWILTGGYTHFFEAETDGGTKVRGYGFVPLKAGLKIFPSRNLYLAGEVGVGFGTDKDFGTSFVYAPAIGLAFAKGFDISLRYEDFTKHEHAKQVALRLAYGMGLR